MKRASDETEGVLRRYSVIAEANVGAGEACVIIDLPNVSMKGSQARVLSCLYARMQFGGKKKLEQR